MTNKKLTQKEQKLINSITKKVLIGVRKEFEKHRIRTCTIDPKQASLRTFDLPRLSH
jgi:hypothetical protein